MYKCTVGTILCEPEKLKDLPRARRKTLEQRAAKMRMDPSVLENLLFPERDGYLASHIPEGEVDAALRNVHNDDDHFASALTDNRMISHVYWYTGILANQNQGIYSLDQVLRPKHLLNLHFTWLITILSPTQSSCVS